MAEEFQRIHEFLSAACFQHKGHHASTIFAESLEELFVLNVVILAWEIELRYLGMMGQVFSDLEGIGNLLIGSDFDSLEASLSQVAINRA